MNYYLFSFPDVKLCGNECTREKLSLNRERERARERESARSDHASFEVSIRCSVADTVLNFRKLIKLAHVRYVRRTNKDNVKTSSPIRACSHPSFSFLVCWSGETPFRSGKRENNGSNLDRSQCTTCWCFLADKAPVHLSSSVQTSAVVARHKSAFEYTSIEKPCARLDCSGAITKGQTAKCKTDASLFW